jgi:hypothetical protein
MTGGIFDGVFGLVNSVFGGLGGLFSGLFGLLSDRRLKSDVVAVNWSR